MVISLDLLQKSFGIARLPQIQFGLNQSRLLHIAVCEKAKRILLVRGGRSLVASPEGQKILAGLRKAASLLYEVEVAGEPSPQLVDSVVQEYKGKVDLVLGIGGGSVLDAGKAISAMLLQEDSVYAYLEVVGEGKKHNGVKVPFWAVPTTAGTGSEVSKNAVLSVIGENGFKQSIRHENFVPDVVLVDPSLLYSCPADVTAACGMDALTQLIESYVSSKATPFTDSLVPDAVESMKAGLVTSFHEPNHAVARTCTAYGALISGITLANAGLGIVHGLASTLGGRYNIPHGVICGSLVGSSIRANIAAAKRLPPEKGDCLLRKYADLGNLFAEKRGEYTQEERLSFLTETIEEWTRIFRFPAFSSFGVAEKDLDWIVSHTEPRNNPVELEPGEVKRMLEEHV